MEEVRKGYKMTDVGVIPEDWEVKEIGTLLKIGNGSDYKHLGKGNIPVYGTGGLITYVDDYLYEGETVCIGRKGTIDKPLYFNGKIWTVDTLFYTHSFINSLPKYIYYNFLTIDWKSYNEASGVPSLSQKIISKILIGIPKTIIEQTAIATALSDMDSLISALDKKIEKKKAIKQGLMQQLLTGKQRLTGFMESWTKYTIEELFELGNGYTPSKTVSAYWTNGTIPWFRMEDIRLHGRILKDSIQHITPAAVKAGGLFPKDSIILSTTATIGEHAWLIADSLANQQFTFLNRKVNRCNTLDIKFFFYYCYIIGDWCRANVNEGGLAAVNMDDLKKYEMCIPSTLAEQTAIATILSDCDQEISSLEAKRDKYKEMKQGMMQQLLTGNIRLV